MTVIRVVKGEIIDHSNNDHTIKAVKKGEVLYETYRLPK